LIGLTPAVFPIFQGRVGAVPCRKMFGLALQDLLKKWTPPDELGGARTFYRRRAASQNSSQHLVKTCGISGWTLHDFETHRAFVPQVEVTTIGSRNA
jgi:hypothetical protein